jgi:hypothetical protein
VALALTAADTNGQQEVKLFTVVVEVAEQAVLENQHQAETKWELAVLD